MQVLSVLVRTIKVVYDELFLFVWLSILWWLSVFPTFLIGAFAVQFGLGIFPVPSPGGLALVLFLALLLAMTTGGVLTAMATAGLHRVANRVANYQRVDSSFFWEGATYQVRRSWLLLALTTLLIAGLIFNIVFYLTSPVEWMRIIGIAWIWVLLVVLMATRYTFALFWQQEEPSLRLIVRNALVLTFQHPFYTLLLLLIDLVWIGISAVTVLPFFTVLPAVLAVSANVSLVTLLQQKGLAPPPPPGA